MVAQLNHFHKPAIGREAAQDQASLLHALTVSIVELKSVAVALVYDRLAICPGGFGAWNQVAWIRAEAHRAAHVGYIALVGHDVNHGVGAARVNLRSKSMSEAQHVA